VNVLEERESECSIEAAAISSGFSEGAVLLA
jgi:predicted esterase